MGHTRPASQNRPAWEPRVAGVRRSGVGAREGAPRVAVFVSLSSSDVVSGLRLPFALNRALPFVATCPDFGIENRNFESPKQELRLAVFPGCVGRAWKVVESGA